MGKLWIRDKHPGSAKLHTGDIAGRLEKQLLLFALERHVPAGVPLRLPLGVLLRHARPVHAAEREEGHYVSRVLQLSSEGIL
jgi:hypothetical protein